MSRGVGGGRKLVGGLGVSQGYRVGNGGLKFGIRDSLGIKGVAGEGGGDNPRGSPYGEENEFKEILEERVHH